MPKLPNDTDATYSQRVFLLSGDDHTHGDGWHYGVLCDSIRGGWEGAVKDYAERAELPPGTYTFGALAGNDLKLVELVIPKPVPTPPPVAKRIINL